MEEQVKKPYKRITKEELSDEGVLNLVGAIVHAEVLDYEHACRSGNKSLMASNEKFFRSKYFHNLTGLDGQAIIDMVRRKVQKEKDDEDE